MKTLNKIINFKIEPENSQLASGIFAIVIAGLAFAATFSHSSPTLASIIGPVTIPRTISALIFALGVLLLMRHFTAKKNTSPKTGQAASSGEASDESVDKMQLLRVVTPWASFALIALYILLMHPIGFTLSSTVYLTLQIPLLSVDFSKKSFLKAFLIGLIASAVVFLIFAQGFGLRLPSNAWGF